MAYLHRDNDPHVKFQLEAPTTGIGRAESNGVVLADDMRVSRHHACVELEDGQWRLTDLGSRNGTFVNGRRITRHSLRMGDRVRVGGSTLVFVLVADPLATMADPGQKDTGEEARDTTLSEREREILALVGAGRTDRQIAAELYISIATVRSHLDRIRDKTGCRRRPELTRLAIELDLR